MAGSARLVVVMGGSSGIGEATAALFAAQGAEVVITGRNRDRLEQAAGRIGGKVTAHAVDATVATEVASFFGQLDPAVPIDHLVLALTGGAGGGPFASLDLAAVRAGFEGKFWAHLQVLQAALPKLRPDGSVVFVTAASARSALPGTAGLAAINGALEAMVPPLAAELAPLRVTAVSPGVVDTPWWDRMPAARREAVFRDAAASLPLGRVGRPDDVAQAIVMLATNGYITGTVLECAGGAHLATGR
jgi:NAD(P)-dependent dehydrogenase (short-subunit alcohol dehydrogenase family)